MRCDLCIDRVSPTCTHWYTVLVEQPVVWAGKPLNGLEKRILLLFLLPVKQ